MEFSAVLAFLAASTNSIFLPGDQQIKPIGSAAIVVIE
jgi:hypothetical protein